MTRSTRIRMAQRGAVVGSVTGAIAAVLILLVSVTTSGQLALLFYEFYVLPVVMLAGGFHGGAIGLVIGILSHKGGANIGHRRTCVWMAAGALASLALWAVFRLLTNDGTPNWHQIGLLLVYGAVFGLLIGVWLTEWPSRRKILVRLSIAAICSVVLYIALGVAANAVDHIDTEALGPVHCVAVSPDGRQILSGHQDGTVRVWDADTGSLLQRLGFDRACVVALACSPDGRVVAVALGGYNEIRILDLPTNQWVRSVIGHTSSVNSVGFSSDGRLLVSGSSDHTVRIWDARTGTQLHCCEGHQADVNCVQISSDGSFLASGGGDYWGGTRNDPSVRLWDANSGRELPRLDGEADVTKSLAISPGDRYIASAGWDKGILLWDIKTRKLIRQFGDCFMRCVAFTPDGKRIISGDEKGNIGIWDVDQGQELGRLHGNSDEIWGLAVMPNGKQIVTCSGSWSYADRKVFGWFKQPHAIHLGCSINTWDLETFRQVGELNLAQK